MRGLLPLLTLVLLCAGISLSAQEVSKEEVRQKLLKLQVPFIKNEGQVDKRVKFYARTFGGTLFVTEKGELVYSLPESEGKAVALKETLIKGKVKEIRGKEKAITKVSYFRGKPENWRSNIPTYLSVSMGEVYRGIELELKAYGGNVEKIFRVKPGSSPEKIRIKVEGGKLSVDKETGELVVKTELGEVRFTKPVAYQEIEGRRKKVKVSYTLVDKNTYGFKVGKYDRNKELVIDPLLASTYLGGSSDDLINAISIDSSGNVYVAGWTSSTDFPTTSGALQTTNAGGSDAFVSKLSSDLTSLLASTYLGGSSDDLINAISIDSSGNVYVAGSTLSTDFPTTTGAFQTTNASVGDAFVSKLSSDLSSLLASTYLGGSSDDYINAISIDGSGNVYVAGKTRSTDFPTTTGALQTANAGGSDAFVSKLSSDLTSLLASTYLGGSSGDQINAISIDSSGNVYVAGSTPSTDFPTTTGALQTANAGGSDVFVSKLSSDLSSLLASTYLGGSSDDYINAISIDSSGNVYVAGSTLSTDFPTTTGAFQTTNASVGDAFVSKLSSDLSSLLASTYLGGSNYDWINAVSIDGSGNVYVAGGTWSTDFPTTTGAFQTANAGIIDGFVSKLNSDLTSLLASTYLGGSSGDQINAISIDSSGNVYVAGWTSSTDFPTTSGALQTANAGGYDAFVSKFSFNLPPSIGFFVVNPQTGYAPLTVTFSWNVSDPDGDTLTCYLDIDNDGNTDYTINDCANNTSQQHTYNTAGNYTAKLTVDDGRGGTVSQNVSIVVNAMVYYTLSINKTGTGNGAVTSNPSGIDCGNSCQAQFSKGTTVTLTATPSQGSVFSGWGGDCSSCGTNTACSVTLNADLNCSAQFDLNQPPQINSFTASPSSGTAPLTVNFTCDAVDPDGSVTEYRWDFEGDGQINTVTATNTATFTYNSGGTYTAKCTAVDNLGATAEATVSITVSSVTSGGGTGGGASGSGGGGCSSTPSGSPYLALLILLFMRGAYRLLQGRLSFRL